MTAKKPSFGKILVANRGEIACRIIKTARRMGIATVAIYSDVDANSPNVSMADEAVRIGGAAASNSYLLIEKIIEVAVSTGADAVHPGFGFLSENADFAEGLEKAGVCFVGPPARAIAEMGDKLRSKEIAAKAGVNTIPGDERIIENTEEALAAADAIGYPVMLKASAGGGGKGMRVAANPAEVIDGFSSASSEARSSFGDDRMLVEKFIVDPRHIEIQVMADQSGNIVYLGERECSIQRRNQKIIEEAPSPFVTPALRKAMGEQSVALAKAVGYVSAGTVEFVVDSKHNFYFLEMNTRLQVEHPVTEFVTGYDIVELMIRVAAGEALPFKQKDIKLKGWAIEARIYAEDPDRNFVPSTGRLQAYRPPLESAKLRNDTGVEEGSNISIYYDPMIAKLIAAGASRETARQRLSEALDRFCIRGINHNISFLTALANHPRFAAGDLSTAFISKHFPNGFDSTNVDLPDNNVLPVIATVLQNKVDSREHDNPKAHWEYVALCGQKELQIKVAITSEVYTITADGRKYVVTTDWKMHNFVVDAKINGNQVIAQVVAQPLQWHLSTGGRSAAIRIITPQAAKLLAMIPEKDPPDMSKFLLSPMPGLLVRLNVAVGDKIDAGQELAVVEAMKMENSLRAEQDGIVAKCLVETGQNLVSEQAIIEFE